MTRDIDTRVGAETPEGIELEFRPAGPVARFYAYLIDLAVRVGLMFVAIIVSGVFGGLGPGFLLLFAFLLEWIYPIAFELAPGSATPGKRVMGLRVQMDDGLPVTPPASLTRNLLRAADFLPFAFGAALISMLVRPDFKRLGDIAARTRVVYIPREVLATGRFATDAAPPLAPPMPLTARQRAAVMAFAERCTQLTEARAREVVAAARLGDDVDPARLVAYARWLLGERAAP